MSLYASIYSLFHRLFGKPLRTPQRIQFAVSNSCNLSCKMCPRDTFVVDDALMSLDLFRAGLASVASTSKIILTGWGEPLLNPDLFTMIREARSKSHITAITTNGILLDNHIDDILNSSLDELSISIDSVESSTKLGHGDGTRQLQNIEQLIKRARERKMRLPKLSLLTTMQNDNGSGTLSVVKAAAQLGITRIVLVRLNNHNSAKEITRPDYSNEQQIIKLVECEARKHRIRVDHNGAFFSGLTRMLYKVIRPWLYRKDSVCSKPLDYLFIRENGDVTPCCDLPILVIGNVLQESLQSIWNGKRLAEFRRTIPEYCKRCDHLFLRQKY